MRYIDKTQETDAQNRWEKYVADMRSTTQNPDWSTIPGDEKRYLYQHLREIQGGVCCYCQQRISVADTEIEHFIPRAHFPQLQFVYLNLYAACKGKILDDKTGKPHLGSSDICSKAKDSGNGYHHYLHFVLNDRFCQGYFQYSIKTGEISVNPEATNGKPGLAELLAGMIKVLRLDSPLLKAERKNAMLEMIRTANEFRGTVVNYQRARKLALKAIDSKKLSYPSARFQALGLKS